MSAGVVDASFQRCRSCVHTWNPLVPVRQERFVNVEIQTSTESSWAFQTIIDARSVRWLLKGKEKLHKWVEQRSNEQIINHFYFTASTMLNGTNTAMHASCVQPRSTATQTSRSTSKSYTIKSTSSSAASVANVLGRKINCRAMSKIKKQTKRASHQCYLISEIPTREPSLSAANLSSANSEAATWVPFLSTKRNALTTPWTWLEAQTCSSVF